MLGTGRVGVGDHGAWAEGFVECGAAPKYCLRGSGDTGTMRGFLKLYLMFWVWA